MYNHEHVCALKPTRVAQLRVNFAKRKLKAKTEEIYGEGSKDLLTIEVGIIFCKGLLTFKFF